jgi:hypothetical protein
VSVPLLAALGLIFAETRGLTMPTFADRTHGRSLHEFVPVILAGMGQRVMTGGGIAGGLNHALN